jgi:hypothetical protein
LTAGILDLEKIDVTDPCTPPVEPAYVRGRVEVTLRDLKRLLKEYWKCFG